MKIGIGLPNQVRGTLPTVIPGWAARAEQAGFSTLGSVGRMACPGVMDTVAPAAAAAATTSIGLLGNTRRSGTRMRSPGSLTSCSD